MATIHREFEIGAEPNEAWAALRDVSRINELVTFLGEVRVEGDRRSCELGELGRLDEIIVTVDDERKRLVYSIRESPFDFEHHSASMQVVPTHGAGARFIWVTDVKPDGAVPALTQAIDQAVESFKHTLG